LAGKKGYAGQAPAILVDLSGGLNLYTNVQNKTLMHKCEDELVCK